MNVLLSLLVLVVLCGQFAAGSWDASHRDHILKIHNDYRKAVKGACGINMMKYDRQLETEAKAWAGRCAFEHQMKSRGENIAYYTKFGSELELITKMADMWHAEVKDFNYGDESCGAACHYTQMVWSKTTKVGCYAEDCNSLKNGDDNSYFLVCFYSPAGNMVGEQPYKKKCDGGKNKNKKNGANADPAPNSAPGNDNGNGDNGDNEDNDGWGSWDDASNGDNQEWGNWPSSEMEDF